MTDRKLKDNTATLQAAEEVPVVLINRSLAHKGVVINIYDDLVRVKGHETHWDFIHHDGAAAVVPVTDDGKLLMVRQYRHALGRFTLELPAGKLDDPNEDPMACAARELEEETGYRSDDLEFLIKVNTTVAFCDELIHIYTAKNLIPSKQHLDFDEQIDVEARTVDELQELICRGEITDGKTIAGIMTYARKYL